MTNVLLRAGLAMSVLLGVSSCRDESGAYERACTLLNCVDGLSVDFEFPKRRGAYDVTLSSSKHHAGLIGCAVSVNESGAGRFFCYSAGRHLLTGAGFNVPFFDDVRVVVSEGPKTIVDKSFHPQFSSYEVNGPGCGICTGASIQVVVPGGENKKQPRLSRL